MGAVFVAREPELDRRVAVKVLLGEGRGGEAAARFEREARAVAALQSDHVARVFRVGCLASGAPYMAMELLEGEDLAAALARRGPLPSGEVIALMLQACEGLAEAHERGIVHRDLKPANLFLARRPTGATALKILDFGIAKATTPTPLTATRAFLGTPLYMSPEQINDVRSVDARTDVWALGVVMVQLLTGELPFLATSLPDLSELILHGRPRPPSASCPGLSPALEAVVLRCLEKDPAARYAGASELAAALAMTAYSPAPRPAPAAPEVRDATSLAFGATLPLAPADGPARAPVPNAAVAAVAASAVPVPADEPHVWPGERDEPRARPLRGPLSLAAGAALLAGLAGFAARHVARGPGAGEPPALEAPGVASAAVAAPSAPRARARRRPP